MLLGIPVELEAIRASLGRSRKHIGKWRKTSMGRFVKKIRLSLESSGSPLVLMCIPSPTIRYTSSSLPCLSPGFYALLS